MRLGFPNAVEIGPPPLCLQSVSSRLRAFARVVRDTQTLPIVGVEGLATILALDDVVSDHSILRGLAPAALAVLDPFAP